MTVFIASTIDVGIDPTHATSNVEFGVDPMKPTLKQDIGLDTSLFFATNLKD